MKMDWDENEPGHRTRTSSFRSTTSGFVHNCYGMSNCNNSPSPSSSPTTTTSHSVKQQLDEEELSLWKDLVCSLDVEKQMGDFYSKETRGKSGNLRHGSAMAPLPPQHSPSITHHHHYHVLSRALPDTSIHCIPINNTSSMDLLFNHLKVDSTDEMAFFLKEKTCMMDEDGLAVIGGQVMARGVKRSAADVESPSDIEEGEEEDALAIEV